MATKIKSVERGSAAYRAKILPGEELISINGHRVRDVLDYLYYCADEELLAEIKSEKGEIRLVRVRNPHQNDIGLEFEDYLMDKAHACANHCIFCFIDQLPKGMRETLYFKDDDLRLSFLLGNYITLTNLSERELERIIDLKISPINVSVHTTNPELRSFMLGSRRGGESLNGMYRLAQAGIMMNCQIVTCPGINDGKELERTLNDLEALYPSVNSVSVVPVGLTKHREGLYDLKPFDAVDAAAVVDLVDGFGEKCLEKHGTRIFFCSDEFYLKANREYPKEEYYEDYPQYENGVGLARLLEKEFLQALEDITEEDGKRAESFSIATGCAAAPFLRYLMQTADRHLGLPEYEVYAIENDFFGHTIDVAGLVTGKDLIKQLSGKKLGKRLLIPAAMLRTGHTCFLDDVELSEVEEKLGVPVIVMQNDGFALADTVFGLE